MTKRDWRKDRQLKSINRSFFAGKESLAELEAGAGKPMWSSSQKAYIAPSKGKRINPNSPQGRNIVADVVARYLKPS